LTVLTFFAMTSLTMINPLIESLVDQSMPQIIMFSRCDTARGGGRRLKIRLSGLGPLLEGLDD